MTVLRILSLIAAIGLAAAAGSGPANADDPPPGPRPIAAEIPTYVAPEEPPADTAAEDSVAAEPVGPLDLQDALALALMRNPELEMFSWETRAGEARALQAGKPPNPELDMRLYRLGIPRGSTRPDDARWRIVFRQVLELGAKGRRRFELAQTERELADWDYEAKRIEVATTVTARYVAVVGAQQRVDAWARTVDYFEEMRERVDALVERGAMRSLESHQIRRQLGLARVELQRAEGDLSASRFALAATWGSQSPLFSEVAGDLEPVGPLPDIDAVIELARQSPSIARWDTELKRGEAALALAKAERVPDLETGAGVRWEEHTNERDYLVDAELTLPLFDRKQGDIREARYEMARARAGRRAAEAAGSEEIATYYYRVTESRARSVTFDEEVVPAARAAFEAYRLGLESTSANLGDLLDARRDLARAEAEHTEALVDCHQALAILEGVVGQSLGGIE
jgi:cobalt-zinc-cadmium efflux system outer membrane protein